MIAYCEVSAFTETPGYGNRAGVVLDADGLSEEQMQALAAFLGVPETVFVTRWGDGTARVRYFTPTQEIDFCGHATVALGLRLAQEGRWGGEALALETLVGRVPLRLEKGTAGDCQVWMAQRAPETRRVGREMRRELAAALGIDERMIHRGLPLAAASTGLWSVFVPVIDRLVLDGMEPDLDAIHRLSDALGVSSAYAYAPVGVGRFAARDFAPAVGIPEDPVTGSAGGALFALLAGEGTLPVRSGRASGVVYQGHSLGTPGEVEVEVTVEGQRVREVQVGGCAVLNHEGEWAPGQ